MEDAKRERDAAAAWVILSGKREPDQGEEALRATALRVWPRAEAYARRELSTKGLGDETGLARDVWEQTLQSVSKTLHRTFPQGEIRDLDVYVFGAFAHRLKRLLKKQRVLEFYPSNTELADLRAAQDWKWVENLEQSLELKEIVQHMDDWMKEVAFRRAFGHPWKEIGRDLGLGEAATKKRFLRGLQKLRDYLLQCKTDKKRRH